MQWMTRWVVFILLCSFTLPGDGFAFVAEPTETTPVRSKKQFDLNVPKKKKAEYREDEILVKFKAGASENSKAGLHKKHGSEKIKSYPTLNLHRLKIKKGLKVRQAIELYQADPAVEYAEPNFTVSVQNTPNDPRFSELWGLYNTGQTGGTFGSDISAPAAWDITTGRDDVVVAVIDTGVDYTHSDLAANMWTNPGETPGDGVDNDGNGYVDDVCGINAITGSGDPMDDYGHGTHVAGTIGAAGNNGVGVTGVSWHVKIVACKFLNKYGYGDTSDAIDCLMYLRALRDRGIKVIASNNSWGGTGYSQALYDAINQQISEDVQKTLLFVASAGNSFSDTDVYGFYPADYTLPNVIAVAATDRNDAMASFSNFGRRHIHVGAPGKNILSTLPPQNAMNITGGYGLLSGTSMASPHVSGLAALIKSQDLGRDWRTVKNLILSGGDPISSLQGTTVTGRRINAFNSLTCSGNRVFSALRFPSSYTVGQQITLSALSINCGAPEGPVTATPHQGAPVTLLDDGVAPDLAAGDGIFTGYWTPQLAGEHLVFSSPAGREELSVPPLGITTYRLMEANPHLATPYRQRLEAKGGLPPYSFMLKSGSLPAGLTLDGATGEISGAATATGAFYFTVQVTDDAGSTAERKMEIYSVNDRMPEVWAASYHNTEFNRVTSMVGGQDHTMFVAGGVFGEDWDHFLGRYTAEGNLLWSRTTDHGQQETVYDLALDGQGNIYVAGETSDGGSPDFFAAKYDPAGNVLWSRRYDGGHDDYASGIAVDGEGNAYVTGMFYAKNSSGIWAGNLIVIKYDSAGNEVWRIINRDAFHLGGSDIALDASGNIYVAGGYDDYSKNHLLLRKYDPAGSMLWSRQYVAPTWSSAVAMTLDSGGNILVTGQTYIDNKYNFLTVKYDPAGNLIWDRYYNANDTLAQAIATDPAGNVYVTGLGYSNRFYEGASSCYQYFTVKYDSSGGLLWARQSHAGWDREGNATGIATDGNNELYITGYATVLEYMLQRSDILTMKYVQAPTIGTSSLAYGLVGTAYHQSLSATGGTTPYTWSIASGSLPAGLVLDPNGAIDGAPEVVGSFTVTVQATDAGSITRDTKELVLNVYGPLSIVTESLPSGAAGAYYNPTISATGGKAPYGWSIISGTLPAGVTLASSTGTLSGTAEAAGTFTFTVKAIDGNGFTATRAFSIVVAAAPSLAVGPASLAGGIESTPYSQSLSVAGGTPPYAWSVSSGALPGGLTLDGATGQLSGAPAVAGTYSFAVQVSDAGSNTGYRSYSVTVDKLFTITTKVLLSGAVGLNYNQKLSPAAGTSPYTWSITAGALPDGLDLNGSTGVISGTPTREGTFSFTVRCVDSKLAAAAQSYTVSMESLAWTGRYVRSYEDFATGVAVDGHGNVYATGSVHLGSTMTYVLVKYGGSGDIEWTRTYSDCPGLDYHSRVAVDGDGNIYVLCSFFNGSSLDYRLIKFDPSGEVLWERKYCGSNNDYARGLALDAAGNVYVTGQSYLNYKHCFYTIKYSSSGDLIWARSYDAYDNSGIAVDPGGNVLVSGKVLLDGWYAVILKYDPNGTLLWSVTEKIGSSGALSYLAADQSGNLYLSFENKIVKYDPTGAVVWRRTFTNGDPYYRYYSTAMVMDPCGNFYISAYYNNTATYYMDPLVLKYDGAGNLLWVKTYRAATMSSEYARGLALDQHGNLYLAGNAYGQYQDYFVVKYRPDALCITTTALPSGIMETPYSVPLIATKSVTWTVDSGSLPAGVTLDPSSGALSGTPETPGDFSFVVRADEGNGSSSTRALSVRIEYLVVETRTLKSATKDEAYRDTFTATGGQPPYTWSIATGQLPAGLTLDQTTGEITGTPTSLGSNSFSVQVTDSSSASVKKNLVLGVFNPLQISTGALPSGDVATAYAQTLIGSGGLLPYTWSVTSGTLPTGLTLDKFAGTISGTPSVAGSYDLTVRLTDANSSTATRQFSLVINGPLAFAPAAPPDGTTATAYSHILSASGGYTPYTWSITSGSLPNGLALNSSTGTISGVPYASGTFNFTVQVTDSHAAAQAKPLSLIVNSCAGLAVRIGGAQPSYFSLFQAAYGAVSGGETIEVLATEIGDDLVLNRPVTIRFEGGYDCGYATNSLRTVLKGKLRISDGTVEMGQITLR